MVTNQYENTIIELENIIRDLRKCQPSYESLLASMYPHMPKVYSIITSIPENDKDRIYAQYPDFEFFLQLLTGLAEGIQDGTIKVPK
jgi:hypothetical protein